jgi:hypothetical protein
MKIDRLRYDVTIAIAAYGVNDHIGAEAIVELVEDPMKAFEQLKAQVDAMARAAYPHLYANGSKFRVEVPYGVAENTIEIPIIPSKREVEQEEAILDKILHSETIKELKSWKILITVEKDPNKKFELNSAYDMKMEELTQKETV